MKLRRKRMLEILTLKKMCQADLAAAIGVSTALLSMVLNGQRKLSLSHSKKLIELFGADLMFNAIDWEAMNIRNPFTAVV